MGVSNAVFLAIEETSDVEDAGWSIRVMHYLDFSVPVAIINNYSKLTFTTELNDVGVGSVTLYADDPFWDAYLWNGVKASDLTEHDYLYQCWESGVHRFDFIGMRKKLDEVNDEEEQVTVISGPGPAGALEWAPIFPPNFPAYHKNVHWPTTIPAMQLFYKLLKSSQSIEIATFITMSFSQSKDSAGKQWTDYDNPRQIEIEYGQDLLSTLNMATGQDDDQPWNLRADWHMRPGCILDVRQSYGAHLENRVRFYEGDILDKSRDRDSSDVRNFIGVRDVTGLISIEDHPGSKHHWQRRAYLDVSHSNITDASRRAQVAHIIMEGKKEETSEWTIKVPYDRPTRRPFKDYNVGDWVGVMKYNLDGPLSMMAFRIMAITVDVDLEDTQVELSLQSTADAKRRRLAQAMTRLINQDPLSAIKLPEGYEVPPNLNFPVIWNPTSGFTATEPES